MRLLLRSSVTAVSTLAVYSRPRVGLPATWWWSGSRWPTERGVATNTHTHRPESERSISLVTWRLCARVSNAVQCVCVCMEPMGIRCGGTRRGAFCQRFRVRFRINRSFETVRWHTDSSCSGTRCAARRDQQTKGRWRIAEEGRATLIHFFDRAPNEINALSKEILKIEAI